MGFSGRREATTARTVVNVDVIAPPPGELCSETNNNSAAILLTYATTRVLQSVTPRP